MMISKIRTGIKSQWSKAFLIILLVVVFGGMSVLKYAKYWITGRTDGVALVNGQEISRADFAQQKLEIEYIIKEAHKNYGAMSSFFLQHQYGINVQNPDDSALDRLIHKTLLMQAVERFPLYLSSKAIQNATIDPQSGVALNLTDNEKRAFKEEKQVELLSSLIQNATWVPKFVIDESYASNVVPKKFTIATLPLEHFIKEEEGKEITTSELQKFFEDNKNKLYFIPAKRAGNVWTFDSAKFPVNISDKTIEDKYNKEKHLNYIDKPAQIKIREIRFDDLKGKGLNQLQEQAEAFLKEVTANPALFEEKGTLVDFFSKGSKKKEGALEVAAFRLKTDGDISPVINLGDKGFAVIQRVARKEATYKPLAQVKDQIRKTLLKNEFSNQFKLKANNSKSDAQELKTFIEKNGGTLEHVTIPLKENDQIARRLFALTKVNDCSVFIQEGKGYIVQLTGITTKQTLPFDMIVGQVKKDLAKEKARKSLTQAVNKIKAENYGKESLKVPAYAKTQKTDWVDRADQEQLKKLAEQGLPLNTLSIEKKGLVMGAVGKNDGYIVRLDELKSVDEATKTTKKKELIVALDQRFKSVTMGSFIASLYKNATIDTSKTPDMGNISYEI